MLELIEHVRVLRAAGRDVAIAPYDLPPKTYNGSSERERRMARYLRSAYEALPHGRMLVLTGNVHAMLQPRVFASLGRTIEPMSYHLRDLRPYSINVSGVVGASWGCRSEQCGAHSHTHGGRSGALGAASDTYHYQLVLPSLTVARLPGGSPEQ